MNLREQIGQRLLFRLPGITRLTDEAAEFLVACRAGGVVLFGYNVETPQQVAELNRDLQDLAARNNLPPFIIAVDEEGGVVSRMPAIGQGLIAPSPMALAVAGPEAVRACAEVTARRLLRLGFNLNFAPSLDINNNPANPVIGTRSYGDNPQQVAELSAYAIEGYLASGLAVCAKHFPGHGDTNVDSHFGLPIVEKTLAELQEFELVPFSRAIAAGVPAIMTAHVLYPHIEPSGLPATLSKVFLTDLLRHAMNFEGLIITDALDMRAIADHYPLGEGTQIGIQAGADLVMSFSMSLDEQRQAYEEVVARAEAGDFDPIASAAALDRLAKWRDRFATPTVPTVSAADDYQIIAQAARQGITVAHAQDGVLPLRPDRVQRPLLVDFTVEMASPVEEGRRPGPVLEHGLQAMLPNLRRLELPAQPDAVQVEQTHVQAAQSDLLIAVVRNALWFDSQAQLVQDLIANSNHTPVIVIVAREPYDLQLFGNAAVAIATYGDPPATMRALAELLTEEQFSYARS